MGGGGTEGVGLWSKRVFGGGRRPPLSLSSAMPCRTLRADVIQGGAVVCAKNDEVDAELIGVKKVFGSCRGNLGGGPSGGFGPAEGLGTPCSLGMVA